MTGSTSSLDFPVTKGAYASKGTSFLFPIESGWLVGLFDVFAPATSTAVAVDCRGIRLHCGHEREATCPLHRAPISPTVTAHSISTGFLTIIRGQRVYHQIRSPPGPICSIPPTLGEPTTLGTSSLRSRWRRMAAPDAAATGAAIRCEREGVDDILEFVRSADIGGIEQIGSGSRRT